MNSRTAANVRDVIECGIARYGLFSLFVVLSYMYRYRRTSGRNVSSSAHRRGYDGRHRRKNNDAYAHDAENVNSTERLGGIKQYHNYYRTRLVLLTYGPYEATTPRCKFAIKTFARDLYASGISPTRYFRRSGFSIFSIPFSNFGQNRRMIEFKSIE